MALRSRSIVLAALGGSALFSCFSPTSAEAQEALQNSIRQSQNLKTRSAAYQQGDYNLKLGPVDLKTSAGMSVSYTDNVHNTGDGSQLSTGNGKKSDFYITPNARIGAIWQVTELNRLDAGVSFGYNKYADNSQLDRAFVTPDADSQISYDFFVSIFRFNIHDSFSYTQDVYRYGQIYGVGNFGALRNTAGVSSSWALKDMVFSVGYDYGIVRYPKRSFDQPGLGLNASVPFSQSDNNQQMLFARGGYMIDTTLQVGLETSAAFTTYDGTFRNDNQNYTVGPFVEWAITQNLSVTARGGMNTYKVDSKGSINDSSTPGGLYASVDVNHKLNDKFSHSLSAGQRTTQGLGLGGNFLSTTYVRYTPTYRLFEHVAVNVSGGYETSTDSSRFYKDDFDQYSATAGMSYELIKNLSTSLNYQFHERSSSQPGRSYQANVITLSAVYHF